MPRHKSAAVICAYGPPTKSMLGNLPHERSEEPLVACGSYSIYLSLTTSWQTADQARREMSDPAEITPEEHFEADELLYLEDDTFIAQVLLAANRPKILQCDQKVCTDT